MLLYMKMLGIYGELNLRSYFQNLYLCEDKLFVGILHSSLYSVYIFEMSHKYVS